MAHLRVAGAQLDLIVGDLAGNRDRILDAMVRAEEQDADVLLLPELAVTGYPPEDLLHRADFVAANLEILDELAAAARSTTVVVGFVARAAASTHPRLDDAVERIYANAAALLADGRIQGVYDKILLPNYGVFDEDRYFVPGTDPGAVWEIAGVRTGVSVCEDIWRRDGPAAYQAAAGAQILLNINASPYRMGKSVEKLDMLRSRVRECGVPIVYVNLVGGQDELVFDGQSIVLDVAGEMLYRGPEFESDFFVLDVPVPESDRRGGVVAVGNRPLRSGEPAPPPPAAPQLDDEAEVYAALVRGLRDYVHKNGFREVVVALSGGIDSAMATVLAVDALGPDAVWAVSMPTRYSSAGSVEDSQDLASRLGCRFDVVPIDDIFAGYLEALASLFAGTAPGIAEENLQARIRGAVVMALSNKFGGMVVTTGNKSEMAVGYATLYGDMVGGFAPLKDVFKTLLYRLARWRNSIGPEVIPQAIIDKAPSAELRPDQFDTDSLPPYDVLDPILAEYIERDLSPEAIVRLGFDAATVEKVIALVDRSEYKRRQSAPGVRITGKAFGKDRRLPITNRFRHS
jgi:NAD+ synthase (glutamine-hydrolysing)